MFTARRARLGLLGAGLGAALGGGCASAPLVAPVAAPHELQMTTQPPYTVEPPDLLQIDLLAAVPKPPYRIRPLDVLGVAVPESEPPITGAFTVEPDGTIYLGNPYGSVPVAGKTIGEARAATEQALGKFLKKPTTNLSLAQTRAAQQVRGPHLVRADGTIGLGTYGAVPVTGLTIDQVKKAVEAHLAQFFLDPEVAVDVVGYNSRVYYVVFDYGGAGQQVIRQPLTGNETVLDGIGQTTGLPTVSDGQDIWVSRRQPDDCPPQVLPVDWKRITEVGDTRTNYQLMAGDRIFVKAHPLISADVRLARLIAPIERVFGVVLLGSSTVNSIRTDPNRFGGFNNP